MNIMGLNKHLQRVVDCGVIGEKHLESLVNIMEESNAGEVKQTLNWHGSHEAEQGDLVLEITYTLKRFGEDDE